MQINEEFQMIMDQKVSGTIFSRLNETVSNLILKFCVSQGLHPDGKLPVEDFELLSGKN